MILTVVLTGASFLVALLVVYVLLVRYMEAQKRALLLTLRAYFESPDAETPSEFSQLTDALCQQHSTKMVAAFKGSFMGMQSVEAKNVQKLEGDIAQDVMAQQHPGLGALLSSFPAVSKRLASNPQLTPLVEGLLGKLLSKGASPGTKGNDDFAKKLKEYNT